MLCLGTRARRRRRVLSRFYLHRNAGNVAGDYPGREARPLRDPHAARGLAAFSALPLVELTQRCINVRDLWGTATKELETRLGEARGIRERIAAADRFLIARLKTRLEAGALARRCAEAMQRTVEAMSIAEIAADHDVGYKRLERAFLRDVGLTPKHFAKVARLQRALKLAITPSINLATAALDSGYADQAHMTRDFKQLVGRAPRAFLAERFAVFETMRASGSIGLRPFETG